MDQSTLIKGAGGLVALGGTGAGGYLVYESYSEKTIEQVLNNAGLEILTSTEEDKWNNVINAYKDDSNENTETGFISQIVSSSDTETINKFIKKCKETVIEKFKDANEKNFRNTVRWCVGEATINGILDKLNLTLIEDGETEKWKESIEKIEKDKEKLADKSAYTVENLSSKCSGKTVVNTINKDYWSEWEFVSNYCVKSKS